MSLEAFYTKHNEHFSVNRQQGSAFAKTMANDFNPLHDKDGKKFIVPGDLQFALAVERFGLSQKMTFSFNEMVNEHSVLRFRQQDEKQLTLNNQDQKVCMNIETAGEVCTDPNVVRAVTEAYVRFSGKTFPHILVPLMKQHDVMINAARPLVMYKSMHIHLQHFNFESLDLKMEPSHLHVNGKRGDVQLNFSFVSNDKIIGRGEKNMLLSGLRKFDDQSVNALISTYAESRDSFQQQVV